MGEQIRTQQAERKAAKAALEAYYQTHEDQRPAQTTTDAKQSVAPEAKSMPDHGYETESQETQESAPAEFTVDDIIYAYLDTGELTPEQEAFLQTQEINGLEDLKAMIPPGMLPPEMEKSGPDNEEI